MNIGYDAKRAFGNFTGLGNYSRSVIGIMARFYPDNNYTLYTPPFKRYPSADFLLKTCVTVKQPEGIWRTFHPLWRSFRLASSIKNDKIDIFHGLSHELPYGIGRTGATSAVTMHDLIVLRYPHLYKPVDRKIYIPKYRYACSNADLVIAVGRQTEKDLIDLMGVDPKKIRTVYQGCDNRFRSRPADSDLTDVKRKYDLPDKYILNVGTIEPRKNLSAIVAALRRLPDEINLVAVGKPTEYIETVKREIKKFGLVDRVRFLHGVTFADLPAVYALASVFVYPSIFEGFGIPILEALNMRIPTIAANTSSLPEAGGDAALYFDPDDSDTLATHIGNVLDDSDLRKTMIEKGLAQAEKFSDRNVAASLNAVYSELTSRRQIVD